MTRLWLAAVILTAALISGCEGGSGVSNGRIQGTILAPRAGVSGLAPAAGVTVQAEREDSPRVIRTTTSNSFGNYQFDNMPTGTYTLTFFGAGFQSNPLNRAVTTFVEPDKVATVPDVVLQAGAVGGSAIVQVNVIDAVTGDAVSNATVTVGTSSTSGGSNGVYTLFVPVTADASGQPAAQRILVSAESHLAGSESPNTVIPIANQTVTVTVRMQPSQSVVQGVLRASAFDDLYRQTGAYGRIQITADSIDPAFLNPQIEPGTGRFSVRVPSSSATSSRRFNLVFSGQGFYLKVLSNLIAPRAGATSNLSSDVVLEPVVTTLEGNVVTSSGSLPAGQFDQVSILELGLIAPIVNGAFFFTRVPVGIALTVRAVATNPFRVPPQESGSLRVTPADNGSGRFVIGAIQTR